VAEPGTPDWWLHRLYGRLRARRADLTTWDEWYSGDHPAPEGYEKATPLLRRLLDTIGLNVLPKLADAAADRMYVEGFKVNGEINQDAWDIWQGNRFDSHARLVFQERLGLSTAYVLVDPNRNREGFPTLTPEHPEQCIVEHAPGSQERVAGLKVWLDDLGSKPTVRAMVYLPNKVYAYAAPARSYTTLALTPRWELQRTDSGDNPLEEVSLVPFYCRLRMLKQPTPEWLPALSTQRRINKTLLDRMAMQDQGAFKALWATGLDIPTDPDTGQPVEPFKRAIDRLFVNENPAGKFGQLEAEDIQQMLLAVEADIKHASILVPTPPDQLLGEIVNVSEGGLKAARDSLARRVEAHKDMTAEPLEDVARLALKAAGKQVPNVTGMTTVWRDVEDVTMGAKADAAVKWDTLGVPRPALWEKFLGAGPGEIRSWKDLAAEQAASDALGLSALAGFGPVPDADAG
jgi:hypothetical protein